MAEGKDNQPAIDGSNINFGNIFIDGSLLVSPRLFVRRICYECLKTNRLDATINARCPRDVVQHAERNVCVV